MLFLLEATVFYVVACFVRAVLLFPLLVYFWSELHIISVFVKLPWVSATKMTCFLCVSCEKEGFQVIKNIFVTFGDLSFVGPFLLSAQCFFCGGGHVFFRTGAWDPPPCRSWDHLPFLGLPAIPATPMPFLRRPDILGPPGQCWDPLTFLGPPLPFLVPLPFRGPPPSQGSNDLNQFIQIW